MEVRGSLAPSGSLEHTRAITRTVLFHSFETVLLLPFARFCWHLTSCPGSFSRRLDTYIFNWRLQMLFNENPVSAVTKRQHASSLVVSYQSRAACPHCGTYSSRRIHRNWLERIRTYFTNEVPFLCSICCSKYYAGFVEFVFDQTSTANAGLMSLHKALGPILPLQIRESQSSKQGLRARNAHSLANAPRLQQEAGSN